MSHVCNIKSCITVETQVSLENVVGDLICNYVELIDRIRIGETDLEEEKESILTDIIQKLNNLGYTFQNREHAKIMIFGMSAL